MMKRLTLILLALLVSFSVADAKRKTAKAGQVVDGWFVDAENGFKLKLPEGWSVSIKDSDEPVRMTLVQKNYQVPPDYVDAEDYTQVPRVTVYVTESDWSAIAFRDSLLSKTYESDQKKDVKKYFEILNDFAAGDGTQREPLVTKSKETMYVDSLPAVRWYGESQYIKSITLSVSAQSGKRVYGDYAGTIVAVKNGKKMLLFHLMTEGMYHGAVWQELLPVIQSLDWPRQ